MRAYREGHRNFTGLGVMWQKTIEKLKNKCFWAGVATAIAGVLTGAMSAPEAIINVLQQLIGG